MIPTLLLASQGALALTGTEFADQIDELSDRDRQAEMVCALLDGDVPAYLEGLTAVRWAGPDTAGGRHTVELQVMRDYLAVGTNADYLRAPLDLPSAILVARELGMVLPTSKIVDEIYADATQRFAPQPMPPSDMMRSVSAYMTYRSTLDEQGAGRPAADLRAGHKKDLVLTPRLDAQPDRVAIYGWHRQNGEPIQPLCLWHGAGYTDYSHGVRLVSPVVLVDGVEMDLFAVLADPVLWPLVSHEGPWDGARDLVWPDENPRYPEYVPD
ncbi:MAG: hypothetical protein ACI9K2_000906 [Myxococcota bacterium]